MENLFNLDVVTLKNLNAFLILFTINGLLLMFFVYLVRHLIEKLKDKKNLKKF